MIEVRRLPPREKVARPRPHLNLRVALFWQQRTVDPDLTALLLSLQKYARDDSEGALFRWLSMNWFNT